jgi:uncharacterized protein YraI
MNNKKVLSLTIATFVLCGGTSLLSNPTNVKAATISKTAIVAVTVTPNLAGVVKITAVSGANVRSGPGTNYSIVGTAAYGAELAWYGVTKKDAYGVDWYEVLFGNHGGWVSSKVGVLH